MEPEKHIVCFNVNAQGHIMPTRTIVKELVKKNFKVTYVVKFTAKFDSPDTIEKTRKTLEDLGCTFVNFDDMSSYRGNELGPFAVLPDMLEATNDVLKWSNTIQPKPTAILFDPFSAFGYLVAKLSKIPAICSISYFCVEGRLVVRDLVTKIEEKYKINLKEKELSEQFPFTYTDSLNILYTIRELSQSVVPEDTLSKLFFAGAMVSERKDSNTLLSTSMIEPLIEKRKSGKKILFISLGTVINLLPQFSQYITKAYQIIIDTVKEMPHVHAIFSLGPKVNEYPTETLPPNCEVFPFVPQLEVLKLSDIFLTHGGNNSVNEALYFGVPMLVLPFFGDQPTVAKIIGKKQLGLFFPHDTGEFFLETSEKKPGGEGISFANPDRKSFTQETLSESMNKILNDDSILKSSKINF